MRAKSGILVVVIGSALLGGCDNPAGVESAPLVTQVAAGGDHSCAVRVDGAILCWGRGQTGELGHGLRENPGRIVKVSGEFLWIDVKAGRHHTCGMDIDAVVRCWGWNVYGQLGTGAFADLQGPIAVAGQHRFLQFDLGWDHSCGVAADRAIYCWGRNDQGQFGNGETIRSNEPVRLPGSQQWAQVAAGAMHTCGLAVDGRAWCWGLNHLGQLGDGTTVASTTPRPVLGEFRFTALTAGFSHTCGLTPGGAAYCWGSNEHGELGNGNLVETGVPGSTVPSPVIQGGAGGIVFTEVSAGLLFTCGVDDRRRTFCWGRGLHGQIGTAGPYDKAVPQNLHIPDTALFVRVSAGAGLHACALSSVNTAYCWGRSDHGQVGRSAVGFTDVPVRVDGLGAGS